MGTDLQVLDTSSLAGRGGPQSVGRIFAILDLLAEARDGATLSELAVKTTAPKTSLVGLLSGLTLEGCLVRNEEGRYYLGPRFVALAMRATPGRELIATARPVLVGLVEASGETAVLGVLAPDAEVAIYLDKVESENPIRYAVSVGKRQELYCSAAGKILLAFFTSERRENYLKSYVREKFTAATIIGAAELQREVSQIRREGVAYSVDEGVSGASGVGAAIYAADGSVVASLSIAGPTERMRQNRAENVRLIKAAAANCTKRIGGTLATGQEATSPFETGPGNGGRYNK